MVLCGTHEKKTKFVEYVVYKSSNTNKHIANNHTVVNCKFAIILKADTLFWSLAETSNHCI